MKHIWVVESSSGKKWRPSGNSYALALFTKRDADREVAINAFKDPGLKWRVAKYERVK